MIITKNDVFGTLCWVCDGAGTIEMLVDSEFLSINNPVIRKQLDRIEDARLTEVVRGYDPDMFLEAERGKRDYPDREEMELALMDLWEYNLKNEPEPQAVSIGKANEFIKTL